MGVSLGNRVAYGEATLAGHGVIDYAPKSSAAAEIDELTRELLERLSSEGDQDVEEN